MKKIFNNWRKYRQTYNELMRLTDKELSDIGIHRVDIPQIARESIVLSEEIA